MDYLSELFQRWDLLPDAANPVAIQAAEKETFRPKEDLTISEWAEKYRMLKKPIAEEEGPLRLQRTPYLRPLMDCVLDEDIEHVVFCKSAQVAGTEAMISILGFFSHQEPCAIMLVLADEDTAKYMSSNRIQQMYADSEELRPLLAGKRITVGEMTLANGSYVVVGWASSVAKLASRPIKVIIFDEVDKPGYYVTTKEADPISLGIQRTEAKFNRKILELSTPSIETGNIWTDLISCDCIFDWHVPCPFCGQLQPLRWSREHCHDFTEGVFRSETGENKKLGQVVWEGGLDATQKQIEAAGYKCGECGEVWNTVQKNNAVEHGCAIPRTEIPEKMQKVGFHVNRIYSLLGKSGDIPKLVGEFIKSWKSGDHQKMQGFINNTLAEPWIVKGEKPKESELAALRGYLPPLVVPKDALALTAGIDVQKIGFYFSVWAWTRDKKAYLIHYGYIPEDWEEVHELVFEWQFQVEESDRTLAIWRAAVDTGGGKSTEAWSRTEEIYSWLRENGRGVAWGIKGMSHESKGARVKPTVIDKFPNGKPIPGGLKLFLLDTDYFKDALFWRTQKQTEDQEQRICFHSETGQDFFNHLLAEEKRKNKQGLYKWVQVRDANHYLDTTVYAFACADEQWFGGVRVLRGAVSGAPRMMRKPPPPPAKEGRGFLPKIDSKKWFGR